jgi:hypothetical protein
MAANYVIAQKGNLENPDVPKKFYVQSTTGFLEKQAKN